MGLVYSTDHGKMCPACAKPVAQCCCKRRRKEAAPQMPGCITSVRYETSGRKGKGVTVIKGLGLSISALEDLARKFKQRLGTGGRVQEDTIEIQGDHRDWITAELRRLGLGTLPKVPPLPGNRGKTDQI